MHVLHTHAVAHTRKYTRTQKHTCMQHTNPFQTPANNQNLRKLHALQNVQHTATNCNTLQHSAVCIHKHLFNPPRTFKFCAHDTHCNTCNALQQIATPCNTLQCVYTFTFSNPHELLRHALKRVQHTATHSTHCNTLQHSATCIHKHLFKSPRTFKICVHLRQLLFNRHHRWSPPPPRIWGGFCWGGV